MRRVSNQPKPQGIGTDLGNPVRKVFRLSFFGFQDLFLGEVALLQFGHESFEGASIDYLSGSQGRGRAQGQGRVRAQGQAGLGSGRVEVRVRVRLGEGKKASRRHVVVPV